MNECPLKRNHFKKEMSSSSHQFSWDMLVFRGYIHFTLLIDINFQLERISIPERLDVSGSPPSAQRYIRSYRDLAWFHMISLFFSLVKYSWWVSIRCSTRRCKWRAEVLSNWLSIRKFIRGGRNDSKRSASSLFWLCCSSTPRHAETSGAYTMDKMCLSQTDRRSPFGPIETIHDAFISFHLDPISNLQGVKTRLRWRTPWGSKSETARV